MFMYHLNLSVSLFQRVLICNLLGLANDNIFYENLKRKLAEVLNSEEGVKAIEDLGLLQEDLVLKLNTPLDTLTHYLSKKLCYDQNERDLVILRHDVGILWPDNKRENREINLVLYGDRQGYSAMARTVGYSTAIAVEMILDGIFFSFFNRLNVFKLKLDKLFIFHFMLIGEIQKRGVILPFTPDIYRPILNRLKAEGIEFFETSKWL